MPIEVNQTVKILFEVRVDGELVDGSRSNKPFEFSFGVGQVIAGLEKRIINMKKEKQQVLEFLQLKLMENTILLQLQFYLLKNLKI